MGNTLRFVMKNIEKLSLPNTIFCYRERLIFEMFQFGEFH